MNELTTIPHAVLAEKSVICICMQSEKRYRQAVADGIDADCFWLPATIKLFKLLPDLPRDDKGEIDMATLYQLLSESGELERIGGMSEVANIATHAYSAAGWTHWITTLREYKARRMAIKAGKEIAEAGDSQEAIASAKDALAALTKAVEGRRRSMDARQAVNAFHEQFLADHNSGDMPGKATGIQELDETSGGMRPGEFWVIAGKPSRGKSVLMLQIAAEFIEAGEPVAIFSLEMMASQIIGRMISCMGRIDHAAIKQPRTANKHELAKIKQASEKLIDSPLWIDATAGQNTDTILTESERIRDSHGKLSLVVVDYLQLIRGTRNRGESREEEIARASGSMKQLAKHLGCPVLSGSQLNEDGKTRESRSIEQDADCLLYICDDGVKIGKLRDGQRDTVMRLTLDGPRQKFV